MISSCFYISVRKREVIDDLPPFIRALPAFRSGILTLKDIQKGQRTLVRTLQLKVFFGVGVGVGDSYRIFHLGHADFACLFFFFRAYPLAISGASIDSVLPV